MVALLAGEVQRDRSRPRAAVTVRDMETGADGVRHGVAAVAVALAGQAEVGGHGHIGAGLKVIGLFVGREQVRPRELERLAADHLREQVALGAAQRLTGVGDGVHAGRRGDVGRQALGDLRIEVDKVRLRRLRGQRRFHAERLRRDDARPGCLRARAGRGGDADQVRLARQIRAVVPADKVLVDRQRLVDQEGRRLDDVHRAAAAHGEKSIHLMVNGKLAHLEHAGVLTVGIGAGIRDELDALRRDRIQHRGHHALRQICIIAGQNLRAAEFLELLTGLLRDTVAVFQQRLDRRLKAFHYV